jgi:hypothetical protein
MLHVPHARSQWHLLAVEWEPALSSRDRAEIEALDGKAEGDGLDSKGE